MKIKIRTLKQDKYEVEVEPSYTIEKLQEILEETYKFEKSSQTLIYAGKVLQTDKTIEECKINADDFLVLVIKKKQGATAAPATSEKASSSVASTPSPSTASVSSQSAAESSSVSSSSSGGSTVAAEVEKEAETLLTGPDFEKAVSNIVDMGFTSERALEALKASYGNPSRAIEYLMEGSPPSAAASLSSPPPHSPASQHPAAPPTGGASSLAGVFDGLRQHPQFPQLCQMVQTGGEEALKQVLMYFAQTNRPLLDLIMHNKDEFLRILTTPQGGVPSGGRGAVPGSPNVVRVQVTPDDERVINNLVSMGFDRNRVMEAYFLFEKDETLTANYLINNPDFDGSGGDTGNQ